VGRRMSRVLAKLMVQLADCVAESCRWCALHYPASERENQPLSPNLPKNGEGESCRQPAAPSAMPCKKASTSRDSNRANPICLKEAQKWAESAANGWSVGSIPYRETDRPDQPCRKQRTGENNRCNVESGPCWALAGPWRSLGPAYQMHEKSGFREGCWAFLPVGARCEM
jgi:hypothetical protein